MKFIYIRKNKVSGGKPKFHTQIQGHITRSEIPARLPLPRLYDIATSWMQGTADSRSSRKFLCQAKYNQGWYKREPIFLQKEYQCDRAR